MDVCIIIITKYYYHYYISITINIFFTSTLSNFTVDIQKWNKCLFEYDITNKARIPATLNTFTTYNWYCICLSKVHIANTVLVL